ncbi:ER membrane protein [Perilla frutescens var. hirtella]|uniref:ER membrane protein n=1 Tax=Perilla frutescens var. hirtella TaxID=608512 RepID=A0AAD4P9E5_PERFH|nr:ER membrane protein [Perilla frutescens var. hirtella]KAH6799080.1 ER membrane protein [Perilla frutescens var. frutescens]KAH6807777.1 ER membrane protein [Perilla frutescens var. frutescens]KAH6830637.1 ER membrane protein [Perilla frutescens var. hirtella]
MGLFDLEEQFSFYGAYHSNPINIAVHMIFVWPIVFTALLLLNFIPPFFSQSPIELWDESFLVINYGFLFTVIYALYYVSLDRKAGSLAAFLCFLCWAGSSALGHRLGFSLSWKVALASQLLCWTGQFIGHGVFEKRAPALLDNLAQAFLMAPFFVLLEALQYGFGYEPNPGFYARVKVKVDAEIKAWKDKKSKKIS